MEDTMIKVTVTAALDTENTCEFDPNCGAFQVLRASMPMFKGARKYHVLNVCSRHAGEALVNMTDGYTGHN